MGGKVKRVCFTSQNYNLLNDKKALSNIVASLIIILLVIVAAGIIWVVVRNVVQTGAEQIELGKFTFDLAIKNAFIDGQEVKVDVRRSPGGGDLVGVKFIFLDYAGDSNIVNKKFALTPLDQKRFVFTSEEVGGIAAVRIVSIAPIYETGGKEVSGEITDTAVIRTSPPDGGNGNGDDGNGVVIPDSCSVDEDCPPKYKCENEDCVLLCNGIWEQEYFNASIYECDGDPLPNGCGAQCLCETGFSPDGIGGCNLNPSINSGDIFLVWPEDGNAHRFKSPDIPKDQFELQSYTSYYVNFSNSPETRCFRIQTASYFEDIDISEIGLLINFLFDPLANVSQGQQYAIWEAAYCGLPEE